jgi:hypothetical protein
MSKSKTNQFTNVQVDNHAPGLGESACNEPPSFGSQRPSPVLDPFATKCTGAIMKRSCLTIRVLMASAVFAAATQANAALGEMGTGIPRFGVYSPVTTGQLQTNVWQLENASIPMASGCTSLTLTVGTMGLDAYKIATATLVLARATGRSVRFFAHATRDSGCGVDYIELV